MNNVSQLLTVPMTNDSFNPIIIVVCAVALIGFLALILTKKR